MQQGRYAARVIQRRVALEQAPAPFRYFDKGSLAVVGKNFAVLQTRRVRFSGLAAFFVWAAIHLEFLAQSSLRVTVFVQWVWTYVTNQRGARLVVGHHSESSEATASSRERTETRLVV
jgi:NADH dehydrogenase